MSDTEQLFIVAAVWTVIAAVLARFVPNWGGRIALFAVLVGVPFWELPYGYYTFQKLCTSEGRLQIYEPIAPQRAICFDYPMSSSVEKVLDRGFVRVESKNADGSIVQHLRESSRSTTTSRAEVATAEYCVAFKNNIHLPWRTLRHDFLVLRAKDNAIVARHSVFDWLGMWWQEEASPLLGRGGSCRSDQAESILSALLIGAK